MLTNNTVASAALSGAGTAEEPYLIQSAADLLYLSLQRYSSEEGYRVLEGYSALTADIEISADSWNPIWILRGNFDGRNHIISGRLNSQGKGGIFDCVTGTVKNLNVSADIYAEVYPEDLNGDDSSTYNVHTLDIGGIASVASSTAVIQNCSFSGTILKPDSAAGHRTPVGGIVGLNQGVIAFCNVSGTLYGADAEVTYDPEGNYYWYVTAYSGGIVGWNPTGSIYNCTSTARIIEGDKTDLEKTEGWFFTGALVGWASRGTICSCNTFTSTGDFERIGYDETVEITVCPGHA